MWTNAATVAAGLNRDRISYIKKLSDIEKRLNLMEQEEKLFRTRYIEDDIELMNKLDCIRKQLQTIGHENRVGNEEMSLNAQNAKTEMIEAIKNVQKHEGAVAENVSEINCALQEAIMELMALDDANRLIIAKLLLREMGS